MVGIPSQASLGQHNSLSLGSSLFLLFFILTSQESSKWSSKKSLSSCNPPSIKFELFLLHHRASPKLQVLSLPLHRPTSSSQLCTSYTLCPVDSCLVSRPQHEALSPGKPLSELLHLFTMRFSSAQQKLWESRRLSFLFMSGWCCLILMCLRSSYHCCFQIR